MPIEVVYEVPAQMVLPERLLLYSLVYALRPTLALEIGTAEGGSARIICAAMDAAGGGRLVCVDPAPNIAPEHWVHIDHRVALVRGTSTETAAIVRASGVENVQFDFVLVDGDHSYQGVLNDIEIVSQFLHEGSYLLFHDAHYFEVRKAIDTALRQYPLVDCGLLSLEATETNETYLGHLVRWGGLRLLRCVSSSDRGMEQNRITFHDFTDLDSLLFRLRERASCLPGWHGLVVRKALKFTYRSLLKIGKCFA